MKYYRMYCTECNQFFYCTRKLYKKDCEERKSCWCNFCYIEELLKGRVGDVNPIEVMKVCDPRINIKKAMILVDILK